MCRRWRFAMRPFAIPISFLTDVGMVNAPSHASIAFRFLDAPSVQPFLPFFLSGASRC